MIKKQWYTFQSFVYFNNLIKQTQSKNRASNSLFSFLCISDIFMEFFSCGLQKFNFNVWTTQFLYWVYFNQVCKYELEDSTTGWVIFLRKQILLGPAWHWRITWHDQNLPSLFNLWADKTIRVNLCRKSISKRITCKYELENFTTGWVIFSRKQILFGPAWHWCIS